MDGRLIIFLIALIVYIPMAGALLYVWWKHGKGDLAVSIARLTFLLGSVSLFIFMMTL